MLQNFKNPIMSRTFTFYVYVKYIVLLLEIKATTQSKVRTIYLVVEELDGKL